MDIYPVDTDTYTYQNTHKSVDMYFCVYYMFVFYVLYMYSVCVYNLNLIKSNTNVSC